MCLVTDVLLISSTKASGCLPLCHWPLLQLKHNLSPVREPERQAYSPHCLEKEPAERKWLSRQRPSPWRTNIYCVLITTYTSHCFQDVWATCQKVYNLCFHPDLFSHVILITQYLYHFTQHCEGCICLFSLCLQSKNLSVAVLGGGIKLQEEGGNFSKSTQANGKMFPGTM